MIDDRKRREYVGVMVWLIGAGILLFGFFAVGANLGLSLPVEDILEQLSLLVSIVLSIGGIGLLRLGRRIATKNGEYETYWLG